MAKVNPFTPNSPVHKSMFIGRSYEIDTIDKALLQTKHSNPTHLMILGEKGIGKTSLLNVAQIFAQGGLDEGKGGSHNFLTIRLPLSDELSLVDFALMLKGAIEREINKNNPEIAWFKTAWEFLSRFEAAGVAYRKDDILPNNAQLIQEFIYSLVDTIKALKSNVSVDKKDGIIILLDEADKASKILHLGAFLKNLSESLIAEGHNNILFILTGLPTLRDTLIKSHESSLRLFQELNLQPLSKKETSEVINKGLEEVMSTSGSAVKIDDEAQESIYLYSEGYPHFVQQIGFSVLEADTDNRITNDDVEKGFFKEHGALEMIGDRYYAKLFYKDINVNSQREILTIMANNWNDFVSREAIKEKFTGKEIALNNGIRALKEKGIIIPKDGVKGQYRLQWASFAFWIKYHNRSKLRG